MKRILSAIAALAFSIGLGGSPAQAGLPGGTEGFEVLPSGQVFNASMGFIGDAASWDVAGPSTVTVTAGCVGAQGLTAQGNVSISAGLVNGAGTVSFTGVAVSGSPTVTVQTTTGSVGFGPYTTQQIFSLGGTCANFTLTSAVDDLAVTGVRFLLTADARIDNITVTDAPCAADLTPPTVVTQNFTAQLDATGNVSITAGDVDGGSTDNCGIQSLSVSPATFTCADLGPNTVTLTVTDTSGNIASGTATVTVEDVTPPTTVTSSSYTIQLPASGTITISASDLVPTGSFEACGVASESVTPNVFTCADLGPNPAVFSVTDTSGNTGSANITIIVEDSIPPNAVTQNITAQLDGSGNATITAGDVDGGSTDNCAIASLSVSPATFSCADVGPNTVTLTVTDTSGNTSQATAVVTVEDNIAPTAVAQNATVQLNAAGNGSITAADIDNGSTDACGIASLSVSPNTFTCADVGPNPVVLTVTDNNGNISTANATVTVEDNVAPLAVAQSITVQLDASGNVSITGADVDDGSSDACGIASLSVAPNSFTCAEVGPNPVLLTVTDNNGNVSTASATVTVEDNVAPQAICQNVVINLLPGGDPITITAADIDNGSNDACGIASISINEDTFGCADLGNNTVTLTVTDVNGNVSTCTANVLVQDLVPPAQPVILTWATDTGLFPNDNVTLDNVLDLTGTAERNTTLQLFINGSPSVTVPVDNTGNWSLTTPVLADGNRVLRVRATDCASNTSIASAPLNVRVDTQDPFEVCGFELQRASPAVVGLNGPTVSLFYTVSLNEDIGFLDPSDFVLSGPVVPGSLTITPSPIGQDLIIEVEANAPGFVDLSWTQPSTLTDIAGNPFNPPVVPPAQIEVVQITGTQDGTRIAAFDAESRDRFGAAVSISGEFLFVGVPSDNPLGDSSGSVRAYQRDNASTMVEEQTLVASDGAANDLFGEAVAVDGDRAIVGAPYHDGLAFNGGAAYIFEYDLNTGTWNETQKLDPVTPSSNGRHGSSVAILGNTVAVGVPGTSAPFVPFAGAVDVYQYDPCTGSWTSGTRVTAPDATRWDYFGTSVALGPNALFVGSPGDDDEGSSTGSVNFFRRVGTNWPHFSKIMPATASRTSKIGESLDFSGGVLAVGAPFNDFAETNAGAVYRFERTGPLMWTELPPLYPSDAGDNWNFGFDVGIDGNGIIVGAPGRDNTPSIVGSGALYYFENGVEQEIFEPEDPSFDLRFGQAADFSGVTAVGGAPDGLTQPPALREIIGVGAVFRVDQ